MRVQEQRGSHEERSSVRDDTAGVVGEGGKSWTLGSRQSSSGVRHRRRLNPQNGLSALGECSVSREHEEN